MYEAARVTDPITHTSALSGFLAGAITGIALIGVVASATFTCGFGVALFAGMAAGIGASGPLGLGKAIGGPTTSPTGAILTGSPNVYTNKLNAAFVQFSTASCSKHKMVPPVAEGSRNVFINNSPAARKDDKIGCDAKIGNGSHNVFIGGGTVRYLPVNEEVPDWLRTTVDWAFALAGLAGGLAGLAKQMAGAPLRAFAPCAAKCIGTFAVSEAVTRTVIGPTIERAVGGLVGEPVDVTSGRKVLLAHEEVDISLPGYLPLEIGRFYSSELTTEGCLGRGWVMPWEIRIEAHGDKLHYFDLQGRETVFPRIDPGHNLYFEAEQLYLACTRDGRYVVQKLDERYYDFGQVPPEGTAWVRRVEDQRGHFHVYGRDPAGQLAWIGTSSDQVLKLHYNAGNDRLNKITQSKGGTSGSLVRYHYDESAQLVAVENIEGVVSRRFEYSDGLMSAHHDVRGFISRYRWEDIDGAMRVVENTTSEGERYTFQYDIAGRSTKVTDELGRIAEWRWDENRQVVDSTDFDGSKYHIDYNAAGLPITFVLPGDRTVTLERDELGRIVSETDSLGRTTATDYAGNSLRVTRQQLADGSSYRAEYDLRGLLLASRDALARIEQYDYDDKGLPHTITDARGGTKTLTWNDLGQLTAFTDCSGKTTRYEYDIDGNPTAVLDAMGGRTEYTCTRSGRVTAVTLPDGSQETFRYDDTGLLVGHVDAFEHSRTWAHNMRGQVVQTGDGMRGLRYDYDARGRLIALTNANGAQYRFEYDDGDRLARETRPDGVQRELRYDEAGELETIDTLGIDADHASNDDGNIERPRKTTHFERDHAGRLVTQTNEHAVTIYEWNALDQITSIERAPTEAGEALGITPDSINFEYDKAGRLIGETGVNGSVHYTLDVLDNVTRLTLPQGQTLDTLTYGSGHVHQVRLGDHVISDFERDDLHREIMRTQGRLTQRSGYDALGRRSWQSAALPGQAIGPRQGHLWRHYQYDRHGELAEQHDSVRGVTRYQYDPTGRLLSRSPGNDTAKEQFAWDAAGNLLDDVQRKSRGQIKDNRLRVWQDLRFEYDAFGNLIEKRKGNHQTQTFTYDADDRLINVRTKDRHGHLEATFDYDALGRRIGKTESLKETPQRPTRTEERRFVWQGLRMVQEIRLSGVSNYVYSPEAAYSPLARIDQTLNEAKTETVGSAHVYHFHTDLVGAPLEVTDESGELAWAGRYNAWGKVERCEDDALNPRIDQPLRFAGQYADESTGLHYNTFRYYDPDVGRFINQDPIGLLGGDNLYAYAPNPTQWIDPLGWFGEKPPNSPDVGKWMAKGGLVYVEIKTGTWVYTDYKGRTVRYPDGCPDFSPYEVQRVDVPKLRGDHNRSPLGDFGRADAQAKAEGRSGCDYQRNTWHHHENKKTMQEVPKDIHSTFTHRGGVSSLRRKSSGCYRC